MANLTNILDHPDGNWQTIGTVSKWASEKTAFWLFDFWGHTQGQFSILNRSRSVPKVISRLKHPKSTILMEHLAKQFFLFLFFNTIPFLGPQKALFWSTHEIWSQVSRARISNIAARQYERGRKCRSTLTEPSSWYECCKSCSDLLLTCRVAGASLPQATKSIRPGRPQPKKAL